MFEFDILMCVEAIHYFQDFFQANEKMKINFNLERERERVFFIVMACGELKNELINVLFTTIDLGMVKEILI